jgi:hypothetical protein
MTFTLNGIPGRLAGLLLGLAASSAGLAQPGPLLLRPTDRTVRTAPDPTVIRSQNVIVDLRLLRSADNQRLIVPVFGRETLTLVRDRQEKAPKEGVVWYGKVANEPGSSVVLALVGQAVTGNIRTQKGRFLQIRYLGEGIHSIREIDQSKFPQEAQPVRPKPKPPGGAAADTCNTDPRERHRRARRVHGRRADGERAGSMRSNPPSTWPVTSSKCARRRCCVTWLLRYDWFVSANVYRVRQHQHGPRSPPGRRGRIHGQRSDAP